MLYVRPRIDLAPPPKTSSYTYKKRPRVNFKVERPFLIGAICTYVVFTYVHYRAYSALPPNGM